MLRDANNSGEREYHFWTVDWSPRLICAHKTVRTPELSTKERKKREYHFALDIAKILFMAQKILSWIWFQTSKFVVGSEITCSLFVFIFIFYILISNQMDCVILWGLLCMINVYFGYMWKEPIYIVRLCCSIVSRLVLASFLVNLFLRVWNSFSLSLQL